MNRPSLVQRWRNTTDAGKSGTVLLAAAGIITVFLLVAPKPWATAKPEGPSIPFEYFAGVYTWWGGLIALVGVVALYLTRSWWTRNFQITETPPLLAPPWFWPLVALAVLLTAVMGSMRLGFDLWDDERRTLQQFVQGDYRPRDDGGVRFREYGWGRTLFNYREPNNHILNSILARVSVDSWKIFRSPDAAPFSETATRLPALLFGIGSIAALAVLLKELGLARAGVIAAFLLAIHPWHIRYACEARGYAFVLCLFPLLLFFWLRAMRAPLWRWWIGVGACEFGMLYAYPATLYPVASLNAAVLLCLPVVSDKTNRTAVLTRWIVVSAVAGMIFTWLYLPCVPQLMNYLAGERATGQMGTWWLRDFFSHLFAGTAWFKTQNPGAVHPELFAMFARWPRLGPALAWTAAILAVAGAARICSRGWLATAVCAVLLLPAAAAYLIAVRGGQFLHEWYLIYLLPGAVASVAAGFDSLMLPWRERPWTNWALAALVAVFAGSYWTVTAKARDWLLSKPLQPMRASVLLTRPTTLPNYPGHDEVITASFNTPPGLYDPHCRRIASREELLELMRESDRRGVPLFLNIGNPWAASHHHSELFRMTTGQPYFREVETLAGFDPTLDRKVTCYIPRSFPQPDAGN